MKCWLKNNPTYWKVFEYTEAGTYTYIPTKNCTITLVLVGAGGGGSCARYAGTWNRGRNGGQGALVTGTIDVIANTEYTIVVGASGIGAATGNSSQGTNGGDSTAFGNIAGGGGGSYSHTGYYDGGYSSGGAGGIATPIEGCTGSNGANYSTASKYLTYGGGGIGNASQAGNGQGGYVSIAYESDSSDYTYTVDDFTAKVVEDNGNYKAFRR